MWRDLWEKLKKPSKLILTLTYIATVFFCGSAIALAILALKRPFLALLSYVFYGLAAITLGYTVYTLVLIIPKWKRAIQERLHAHPVTGELMRNFGLRTVVFSSFSFLLTVAFGVYHGILGIWQGSIWFGSLAAYYIILASMRGGVVLYHRKNRGVEREELTDIKKYRFSGILLIVTILALSAAIAQMVATDASFKSPGLMIYVSAAYTFTKISMSIFNFIRGRKQEDYTIEALRNINVADALVSVLTLQTAMFQEFGQGISTGVANAMTGAGVCALVLALGVYMIIKAQKGIKKLQEEEENGKREQI